jgi:hypothetical protein
MNILEEHRRTRALEPTHSTLEGYREARKRLEGTYPAHWPMTIGEFFDLSEDERARFSRYLGAEGPLWQIGEYLFWFDSHNRTLPLFKVMLSAVEQQRRLCIFLDNWDGCDATRSYWYWLAKILRGARAEADITEMLEREARAWFDAAPDDIAVYRGCEAGRERGLSWTFDQSIATQFAHGRRRMRRTTRSRPPSR